MATIQLERGLVVALVEPRALISTRGKVFKERAPRRRAEALTEEVIDLGGHRSRNEQPASLRTEKLENLPATRLLLVGQRYERRRVNDERHRPKP
jgi:hypothetical protein